MFDYELKFNTMKTKLLLAILLLSISAYSQRLHPKHNAPIEKGLEPPTNLQAVVNGSDVQLSWQAPGGSGSQEDLIYDNNQVSGSYSFKGYTMSTHMSPAQDCQVLAIKFYTTNDNNETEFQSKIFNWEGTQPGTTVLYNSTEQSVSDGWVEFDVSAEEIFPDGDFVVGFGSIHDDVYLGYDSELNNGRSWDLDGSSMEWYTYTEAYLIRARVLYPSGDVVELGGKIPGIIRHGTEKVKKTRDAVIPGQQEAIQNQSRVLSGLLGYNVYRDGTLLNADPLTATTYFDGSLPDGTYSYTVSAVYDEGISDPAGPVEVSIPGSNLPPPLNLSGSLSGETVELWWVNPDGGTVEELVYDNNEATDAYKFPGTSMSTKMSPAHACQILKIKYFTTVEGINNTFFARIFGWEESMPGTYDYLNQETEAINQDWVEIDLEEHELYFSGDFIVGFGSHTEDAYLGYDANLDNDRSWDFNEATSTWTTWNEAYLIRALVRYGDGTTDELGSKAVLQGYNVYRNDIQINQELLTTTHYTDQLSEYGDYNYNITAIYDEGESAYSNTLAIAFHLGISDFEVSSLKVYPNPAHDIVKIESDYQILQLSLMGVNGAEISGQKPGSKDLWLDTGTLSPGVYILKVTTEKGIHSTQLLIR